MITLAKTAGFCFGVDRAVKMVYELLDEGKKVATLGPIIHNPQLVSELEKRGVRIINDVNDALKDEVVVIRSHGVEPQIYDSFNCNGQNFKDATCPYVKKIHNIVKKASDNSEVVIILGDKKHPEVKGIIGYCNNDVYVVESFEELEKLSFNSDFDNKKEFVLVAQTTYNKNFWEKCSKIAKKLYTNIKIFDTICSATNERQSEAENLARFHDLMLVIGGRESSNTKKLTEISSKYCEAILIETKDELYNIDFNRFDAIGVTAGASTPAYIIEEVLKTMDEILRNEENEMDFATLLEQSMESEKIYNGKRVKGIVTYINPNEVHVDIGAKQSGIIPISELSDDPNLKVDDILKKGDEIDLCVVKVNDQEGIVTLSKKRCDSQAAFENIKKAYQEETVLDATITDVVRGGVLAFTLGTKIFIPASQSSNQRVEDLQTLLKKQVKLKIIEINELKNRAKGSVRAVASQERKEQQVKFWESVEAGKQYTGDIKSITAYGAFVDLGGVDGMIHITELSWSKIKHPSEVIKEGQTVEVYVKDLDKEKKRISLGYKKTGENPWSLFVEKYNVEDTVEAKIVSFTNYGAFAEILPGIDGLIHISQIANKRVDKVADMLKIGETVKAKIIEIEADKQRVSLSMRALLSDEEQKKEKEIMESAMESGILIEDTEE